MARLIYITCLYIYLCISGLEDSKQSPEGISWHTNIIKKQCANLFFKSYFTRRYRVQESQQPFSRNPAACPSMLTRWTGCHPSVVMTNLRYLPPVPMLKGHPGRSPHKYIAGLRWVAFCASRWLDGHVLLGARGCAPSIELVKPTSSMDRL